MKRVLLYTFLLLLLYVAMFHINKKNLVYVTMSFYVMSLISSLSNLFIRYM